MATYLDIVNLVINESASEADELTESTWDSDFSSRRIYPRIKRNVAQAWKQIQMDRGQWEFKSKQMSTIVYPRIVFENGIRAAGEPAAGAVFKADDNSFQLTVLRVFTESGDWATGDAKGQIEFDDYALDRPVVGSSYTELSPVADDGTFTYIRKGSYSFLEIDDSLRDIEWATFTAFQSNTINNQVNYIPWNNWLYTELEFAQGSTTVPKFVSKDNQGNVVFYPQTLEAFRVGFVYSSAPTTLTDWDDVPENISEEYHEWIGWEALKMLALYDKNPDLYAYASKKAAFFAYKADTDLMPIPYFRASAFSV